MANQRALAQPKLKPNRPHYFLDGTVWEAALARTRWIFDEFDNDVAVTSSGGKDSTVTMELAALVNNERGQPRGPLRVMFLDQEAEYGSTVDYMRWMHSDARPDLAVEWYQVPFRLFNATSHEHQWNHCWDPALEHDPSDPLGTGWLRLKEPGSIHTAPASFRNPQTGAPLDRFKPMLAAMLRRYPNAAHLAGLRVEESPTRRVLMTGFAAYKHTTWSSGNPQMRPVPKPWQFYPVYDWSHRDVWRAIEEHGWRYNTFYDALHRYGVPIQAMRVSAFHHEQSMKVLDYLQELEPETWERATKRLPGINTHSHVGEDIYAQYWGPDDLPYMFTSWQEYLDHLIDNLVTVPEDRPKFRKLQANAERELLYVPRREIARYMVRIVMFNDVYGSNLHAWIDAQHYPTRRRYWAQWIAEHTASGDYTTAEEIGRA